MITKGFYKNVSIRVIVALTCEDSINIVIGVLHLGVSIRVIVALTCEGIVIFCIQV